MKKLLTLAFLAATVGIVSSLNVLAQKAKPTPPAKDLYTQYEQENRNTMGRPGAKMSVLLKRGNQSEKLVSPNSTFYSGDKIKLVLDINFTGYAAILNEGTSGKMNLLFPYMEASELVSHSVSPNAGTKLPRGIAWIVFDEKAGTEKVTVIFSKSPLVELEGYENLSTGNGENSSTGRPASDTEADRILAELNSKSLGQTKDLFVQNHNDASYYVNR